MFNEQQFAEDLGKMLQIKVETAKAISNQLVGEKNLHGLRSKLIEFPEQIGEQQKVINEATKTLTETRMNLKEVEAGLMIEISDEVNDKTGKAKYSNAEARNAELQVRRRHTPEYQAYKNAEMDLTSAQTELTILTQKYEAYKLVTESTITELNLIADLMK